MAHATLPAPDWFARERLRLEKLVYMPVPVPWNGFDGAEYWYRANGMAAEEELLALEDEPLTDEEDEDGDYVEGDDSDDDDDEIDSSDDAEGLSADEEEDEVSVDEVEDLRSENVALYGHAEPTSSEVKAMESQDVPHISFLDIEPLPPQSPQPGQLSD